MATAGPKERAGLREPPVQKTPGDGRRMSVGERLWHAIGRSRDGKEKSWRFLGLDAGRRLTNEFSDEKTQSDPHWCDEVPLMLFRREHENCED